MTKLQEAIVEIREENVLSIVRSQLEAGIDPLVLVEECRRGLVMVGERFNQKEYFLPELLMASEIFNGVMKIIRPLLSKDPAGRAGKQVVIGTVKGDMHDLGKNIVSTLLEGQGFQVQDLGINVEPQRFVQVVGETKTKVVGLSCLLTTCIDSMKDTVNALEDAGLRHNVKILVGGGIMNDSVKDFVGADAYGKNAVEAVTLSKKFTSAT